MLGKADLGKILEYKHVLVDTCILISASRKETEKSYIPFFEFIKSSQAILVTSEVSDFEYLRGARNLKELRFLKELLKTIGINYKLNIAPSVWAEASRLSLLYAFRRNRWSGQVSVPDCLNAALLCEKRDLFLITEDLQDYPSSIFDVIFSWPIEIIGQDKSFGMIHFIKFNSDKFESEVLALLGS